MRRRPVGVAVVVGFAALCAVVLAGCDTTSTNVGPIRRVTALHRVRSGTDLLDWTPVRGSPDDTVVSNGDRVLTVPQSGAAYAIRDRHGAILRGRAPTGYVFDTALMSATHAVVVAEDRRESRPPLATVVNVRSGHHWRLGASGLAPPAPGSWALHDHTLVYATERDGRYCQARLDLAARHSSVGYCVDPRHGGFRAPVLGDHGETLLTFDARRPVSCRTLVSVEADTVQPVSGVPACRGAQAAILADATVVAVVPDEHRYESVDLRARSANGDFRLGSGVNGSLLTCGDAAYWSVDAARDHGRARVMRFEGRRLDTVYRSPPGAAFIGSLSCAGHTLTVSAISQTRDEVVTATVIP